jgi:hypothetical protein
MATACIDRGSAAEEMVSACAALVAEGSHAPPIPLKPLVEALNARWEEREMSADGQLRRDKHGYLINYPPDDERWRRHRFTIAHELAHVVLIERLGDAGKKMAANAEWKEVERLCNQGAAEILLPRQSFAAALAECGFTAQGLVRLYERFAVSWSALFVRIAEILGQAGVWLWQAGSPQGGDDSTLRLVNVHVGERRFWLPKGISDRRLSPNLVTLTAAEHREICGSLTARLDSQTVSGRAVAVSLASLTRSESDLLPGMEQRPIKSSPGADVAVLVLPEGEAGELVERVWRRTAGKTPEVQLELSVAP